MEDKKWVYVLKDPRDNSNKYVGMSKDPFKRLKGHISQCKFENTKKSAWVRKLKSLGLKPILIILKEVTSETVGYWEEYFIKKLLSEGDNLLNYDDKGIGTVKFRTKETIDSIKDKLSIEINQYNLNGELINTFKSLREAERETGINHGNISKCCNGIFKHTGGFIFRKKMDNNIVINISNPNAIKKQVIEIDIEGNELNTYTSISEAAKINNIDASNISRVCNGKSKKTNNRYFKFKGND